MKGKLIRGRIDGWFVEYVNHEQVYPRSGRDAGGNEKYEYITKYVNYYPTENEIERASKNINKEVEFSFGYKTQSDYYVGINAHAIINWKYSEKPNWDDVRFFLKNYITEQGMSAKYVDWGMCVNMLEANFNAPTKKDV